MFDIGTYCICFFVIEPPYIDDSSIERDIRIIRGRQLTLNCPAMGTPYPNISWYRNGFPVSKRHTLKEENTDEIHFIHMAWNGVIQELKQS